jgi:hypothetical protein
MANQRVKQRQVDLQNYRYEQFGRNALNKTCKSTNYKRMGNCEREKAISQVTSIKEYGPYLSHSLQLRTVTDSCVDNKVEIP